MKIAFDPIYAHPLPEGHRFPMLKYELIPGQLIYEGTLKEDAFFSPRACADDIVLLTHTETYLQKLKMQTLTAKEQRHIGFPQSPALTLRELIITQGTIDCCMHAFKEGLAMNVAGGTHHAFADRGEGFCLLNDFAVAANFLLTRNFAKQIMIIDLDVHQGNGTAKIFENNPAVFTFSMHGRHNYPFHKEKSDLDIPLEDGTGDELYLSILQKILPELIRQILLTSASTTPWLTTGFMDLSTGTGKTLPTCYSKAQRFNLHQQPFTSPTVAFGPSRESISGIFRS